jgi:hypothetical protein
MKHAKIIREMTSDHGTFGRLITDDFIRFTGELPDRDNAPNVSCIPEGTYTCRFTFSPRFRRNLYLVLPVDGRTGIRFHSANFMGDASKGLRCQLNGCIALGEKRGTISKQHVLLASMPAVSLLERYMNGEPFELEIINGWRI